MTEEERSQGRHCAYCGDRIGVYEPIVLLAPDQPPRTTSLLAARKLPADGVAMHEGCYQRSVDSDGE